MVPLRSEKSKNDLLNVETNKFNSRDIYHDWIRKQRELILPTDHTFEEESVYYDLKCSPQKYFPCMIFMMKKIEERGFSIYNVFPTRTEIIPKHIKLDTTTLVHLLLTKEHGTKKEYLTDGNLKRREDDPSGIPA